MCGIAGIVRFDGGQVDRPRLQAMNDAMSHRGPDGEGIWIEGPVGLAHRRLAIIDLSTGDQPMFNEDRSVLTVFNGEIYNFRSVRPDLEKLGHTFHSTSDTEVLVHGWESWGKDVLPRVNGMFAFAIYDRKARKILLARDRLGVKPLYYWRNQSMLVFASELDALLASGVVPREIDREALELYLHYQYVPAPSTIYRDVRKLAPAERLEIDLGTGRGEVETWWDIRRDARPDSSRSLEQWIGLLEETLDDAVRIRLISDVPFGAFLSGGTDSGTVVAMMAKHLDQPVRTFSIGIADQPADELPFARQVADRFRTQHEEFRVAPEGLTLLPKLARHFGEPFADSSAIPTYYVSKLARSRVKMVLTGDGGDEMFAGYRSYPWLAGTRATGLPNAMPLAPAAADAPSALRKLVRGLRAALRGRRAGPEPWFERYDANMSHFPAAERRALLGTDARLSAADYFTSRFPLVGADTVVAAAQYVDLKSYLPGDILAKVDRMSMANSLEVRSPLLDYRIAELAFSMPTAVKLPEATLDGSRGKFVLKEFASRLLGRDYVYRPKEGFGIPVARWLREDSSGYLRDHLGGGSPIFDHLDRAFARRLMEEHVRGDADHSAKLWNLLMLDAWFREIHRPSTSTGAADSGRALSV